MLKIIRGEDKTFVINLRKEDCENTCGGDPFPLTGATEIKIFFPGETAVQSISLLAGEVVITDAIIGKITATVGDAKTALMKIGESQTFEASIEFGTTKNKVKFVEQLTVEPTLG